MVCVAVMVKDFLFVSVNNTELCFSEQHRIILKSQLIFMFLEWLSDNGVCCSDG